MRRPRITIIPIKGGYKWRVRRYTGNPVFDNFEGIMEYPTAASALEDRQLLNRGNHFYLKGSVYERAKVWNKAGNDSGIIYAGLVDGCGVAYRLLQWN
jgi:hypothetical protein